MRIVYLGDIVARAGRSAVIENIKTIKSEYNCDVLIVNVDNAAHGFGCTPQICTSLLNAGVNAIVTGDHVWNQKTILPFLDECKRIVRPLNYPDTLAGVGAQVIPIDNGKKILVTEVVGQVFMPEVNNPVEALDKLLQDYKLGRDMAAIFVDVHAEATAEKQALAHYLDGRVSAVIGSHTHVPTCDTIILPNGTAYQTDAGMCGDYSGVIGFLPTAPIERLKNKNAPFRLEPCSNKATVCGTFIETDDKTGLSTSIRRIEIRG